HIPFGSIPKQAVTLGPQTGASMGNWRIIRATKIKGDNRTVPFILAAPSITCCKANARDRALAAAESESPIQRSLPLKLPGLHPARPVPSSTASPPPGPVTELDGL